MKTQKNNVPLTRVMTGIALTGLLVLTASACMEDIVEPAPPRSSFSPDHPRIKQHDIVDDVDYGDVADTSTFDDLDFVLESFAHYEMGESNCTQNPVGLTVFEPYVLTVTANAAEEHAIVINNFADIGSPLDATLRNGIIVIPVQAFAVGDWRYRVRGTGRISYDLVSFEYALDAVGPNGKETVGCRVTGKRQ